MELRKLFDDDLRLKKEHRAKLLKESEGDVDIDDFPLTRLRPAKIDGKLFVHPGTSDLGSVNLRKSKHGKRGDELAEMHSRSNTSDRRLTFAKSEIEKKRERYERKLQQERMISHNNHMRELAKEKNFENCQKLLEFQRRLRNLGVTSLFERRKNDERVRKIKENRKIWNEQLKEKHKTIENEKLENIRRREKLEKNMQKEDDDFLQRGLDLLEQLQTRGKNTIPLLKCIRAASHRFETVD